VTVVDTGGVVDVLLGTGSVDEIVDLLGREPTVAAPDVVVFETLSVMRRLTQHGDLDPHRAAAAIEDFGDFRIGLFPSMPLRNRAWELRANMTAADALYVALAEQLGEPLATKDRSLARAARDHTDVETIELASEN
jgi:predicted nucleic acid-binding protein